MFDDGSQQGGGGAAVLVTGRLQFAHEGGGQRFVAQVLEHAAGEGRWRHAPGREHHQPLDGERHREHRTDHQRPHGDSGKPDKQPCDLVRTNPQFRREVACRGLSHRDGHDGPITAHFTKMDDDRYCVHFRGKFWKCFPFKYTVVLTVTERTEDSVKLAGSSNLGLLFGTFWYEATATDTEFVAHYCSKHDRGVFTMCRCCRAGE